MASASGRYLCQLNVIARHHSHHLSMSGQASGLQRIARITADNIGLRRPQDSSFRMIRNAISIGEMQGAIYRRAASVAVQYGGQLLTSNSAVGIAAIRNTVLQSPSHALFQWAVTGVSADQTGQNRHHLRYSSSWWYRWYCLQEHRGRRCTPSASQ